jgi:hypothetical protein
LSEGLGRTVAGAKTGLRLVQPGRGRVASRGTNAPAWSEVASVPGGRSQASCEAVAHVVEEPLKAVRPRSAETSDSSVR